MQPRLILISLKILCFMISWNVPGSKPWAVLYVLSQVMSQVQDLITMGFLAVGLMAFNPWLIVLLLIAIIPAFLGESYFNDQSYALIPVGKHPNAASWIMYATWAPAMKRPKK
jgi:hypothetical protein